MRWDLLGKYQGESVNHAVFTLDEHIRYMREAINMAQNRDETCREWNLKDEDFTAWMLGWMIGTMDTCAEYLELVSAGKIKIAAI